MLNDITRCATSRANMYNFSTRKLNAFTRIQNNNFLSKHFTHHPTSIGLHIQMGTRALAPEQSRQAILDFSGGFPILALRNTGDRPNQAAVIGHIIGTRA
ncbi:hypothetical protein [Pseudomonas sp. PA-1-6B]|uniref:hypothetical protein n=1 Tax=Pseudomonas sp. PA-1-6B TaxID=2665468 RepID=UPI001F291116